jgi:hypothetical protein
MMMKKNHFLILILFLLIKPGRSYCQISIGPELGLNYSLLRNESESPLLSPVLGIWSKIPLRKDIFTDIGLQYFAFGNKSGGGTNDGSNRGFCPFYYEYKTILKKFQVISLPVMLGLDFSIRKTKVYFYLGFRTEYLFKGRYYEDATMVYYSDKSRYSYTIDKSPFDTIFGTPARRWNNAGIFGLGIGITDRAMIVFKFSSNRYITFGAISCNNLDCSLTLKYSLKLKRK